MLRSVIHYINVTNANSYSLETVTCMLMNGSIQIYVHIRA